MSIQASHHIHLWNLPSSCPFFSFPPSPLPPSPLHPSPLPPSSRPCRSPPHLPLQIASFQILPPCLPLPVAIHPSPSLLTVHPPHLPLPSPLSALASPSVSFSPLPLHPSRQPYLPVKKVQLIKLILSTIQLINPKASGSILAPQSRHATTIIEFLLIYSSKMDVWGQRHTQPTFIIRWFCIYPPNFSPLGLAVWPSIAEQTDR